MSKQLLFMRRYCLSRKLLAGATCCLMALAAAGAASVSSPAVAYAQNQPPAAVVTTGDFPEVTVSVLCPLQNDACLCQQQDGAWLLTEDDVPQTIVRMAPRQVRPKTETTFFLDLYRNQEFVLRDMGQVFKQLIALSEEPAQFSLDRDYFSVTVPDAAGKDTTVVSRMTHDLGKIFNDVTQLTNPPFANLSGTPLSLLLLRALEKMPSSDAETRRSLVVISDGTDRQTGKFLDAVISAATAKQIPVHTIYAPTTSPGNKSNLSRLATGTGGRYVAALEQADWSVLAAAQRVCDLTYRSSNPRARRVVVTHPGADADRPMMSVGELLLDVPVPFVEVSAPAQVEASASPITAGQAPPELTIRWDLAPYPNRQLHNLGYEIQGAVPSIAEVIEGPSDAVGVVTLTLQLENLAAGVYPIRAWVEDELGLRGEADTTFALVAPPTPAPTPSPPPTAQPPATSTDEGTKVQDSDISWMMTDFPYRALLITTALVSLLLALVAFWLWRKAQEPRRSETPSTSLGAAPQPSKAILWRLDSTVDTGVKQTIKLGNKTLQLPEDLYDDAIDGGPARRSAATTEFKATILFHNEKYHLSRIEGEIQLVSSGTTKLLDSSWALSDRDELIFGKSVPFHYRFLVLHGQDQQNGGQPDGVISAQ